MKRLQALMAGMVILCALLPCAAAWAGEPVKVRIRVHCRRDAAPDLAAGERPSGRAGRAGDHSRTTSGVLPSPPLLIWIFTGVNVGTQATTRA